MGASFQSAVRASVEMQKARMLTVAKTAITNLVDEVLQGAAAPIDTGAFMANMNASIGSPDTTFDKNKTDTDGVPTAMRIRAVIDQLRLGDKFFLSNNAPYGPSLEYGLYPNPPMNPTGKTVNGFSMQAPHGVFRVSIAKWTEIVHAAIDEGMTYTDALAMNAPSFVRSASFIGKSGEASRQAANIAQATREFAKWSKRT